MRPQDEMYLVRMAEAEAEGRLSPQERLELDARLAADPAFAIAYQEYFHTISGLHESQRRHDFKDLLAAVHGDVTTPRKPLLQRVFSLRPAQVRMAAVAACVALLTSTITTWTIRHNDATLKTVKRNLELVRRDTKEIRQTQSVQQKDIDNIKKSAESNPEIATVPQTRSTGTGFALTNDGYLVTNFHVVDGAQSIQIQTRDGKQYNATVVTIEPKNDIALLRIDDKSFRFGKGDLPYTLLDSKAALGDEIFTLGFPQDEVVYNQGYISSRNGFEGDSNQYRLEVAAGPGQSGAPVLDDDGHVIGFIRSKDAQTSGTTFAVTSRTLLSLIHDLPKDRRPKLAGVDRLSNLTRQQQIEKLQDYTCMVRVYKNAQ
jgi:serine protease Do